MKLSENWLREWVDPEINHDKLCDQLTMAGLEVEESVAVADEFAGVVIGKIVQCKKHPNADKLRVTKIDIGTAPYLSVVCGAENCRKDLKVACATVGATLSNDFTIKTTELRGEPSEGMLCSYNELGISCEDEKGIIELPEDAPLGEDLRHYLQLNDRIIDVSITPNRADCFSILGIAREVAAINNMSITFPENSIPEVTIEDEHSADVQEAAAAPRFLTRVIQGINAKAKTPLWMKEKLRRSGFRSIDAVVDITNYVMLELGQPMHAYDRQKIEGELIVRYGKPGERLTLLDGKDIEIKENTLVIADEEKVLALAGIFGGEASGISENTETVLLEAAYFAPIAVAGKAREYGLHTESSHRFERGVDPNLAFQAMNRVTQLILSICGGQAGPIAEAVDEAAIPVPAKITLKHSKIYRLLGHTIEPKHIIALMTRLGCHVRTDKDSYHIQSPSWRFDLQIEEDIIEEIARIYGYNNIPNAHVTAELVLRAHPESHIPLFHAKQVLATRGYQEAITYSFVDPKVQMWLHPEQVPLHLPNPISSDMSVMRLSLWSGLLGALVYNQNRQQSRVRLFEAGLRFTPDHTAEFGVRQERVLSGIINGSLYEEHWNLPKKEVDFFDLKGDVEAILALTGISTTFSFRTTEHPGLHPGQTAGLYLNDDLVGILGTLHPQLQKQLGIKGTTLLFELIWDKIADRHIPEFKEISRFPSNRRDIALLVGETVSAAEIIAECKRVGGDKLISVNLFDVYHGENITPGQKSLAISLILQDKSRTLEDSDIINIVDKCIEALQNRFNALLRE